MRTPCLWHPDRAGSAADEPTASGRFTSAGIILAGTFAVLGIAGGSREAQQLGYSIAFGVLLDTFFVRSLLIPSIAMLLGPLNWWPMPAAAAPPALATSKQPALR